MSKFLTPFLVLLLVVLLVACGGGPTGGPDVEPDTDDTSNDTNAGAEEETAATEEPAGEEEAAGDPQLAGELSVYNWSDYIDEEVLTAYEEEYGVDILYDTYASNEDLFAKLQAGAAGYDVIFPSDYMVAQMIEQGMLAEIDVNALGNWGNIDPTFHDPPFDPGNQHCIPYQWGTTGIAYQANNEFFQENPPTSWAYLFDPALLEQYADGGINVLNDQRELIGAALVYLGYDMNTTDEAQIQEARDVILAAKDHWRTFNSEDYDDSLLIPGEVVLSHAWSGDAANAYWSTYDDELEDGEWYYAIPEEGAVRWVDNVCILASSERYETALHFLNYLLEPEVAAAVTNFTYYASPNEPAQEFILEEILQDPGIYPPEEVEAKLQWLEDVGDAIFIYDEAWTVIKG